MDTAVRLEHQLIAVDHDQRLHVMLELSAPAVEGAVRPPMALALVVDRSGSMRGPKLTAAGACAAWLAERLRPDDRLALVTFDDRVATEVGAEPAGTGAVARAARRLQAGGSTNLSGGWLRGRELLEAVDTPTRRIILLTDGLANHGITDRATLTDLARGAAVRGVTTTTVGFGDGFDEDLLTAMADAGRGAAHYAASPDDAAAVFDEEAGDLAALAAQNVAVAVRPVHPKVTGVEILGDWPVQPDGDRLRVEMGDAYAGRSRRLVLALDVDGLPDLGPCQIAELDVTFTTIGAEVAQHTLTLPVTVHVTGAAEAEAAGIDMAVREEVAILAAARAQREAIEAADNGNVAGAGALLRGAADMLRAVACASPRSAEFAERADAVEAFAEVDQWSATDRKALRFQSHRAGRGRDR